MAPDTMAIILDAVDVPIANKCPLLPIQTTTIMIASGNVV